MAILCLLFLAAVAVIGASAIYSWVAEDAQTIWGKIGYGVLVIGAGPVALPIYMLLGVVLLSLLAVSCVK